MRIHKLYQCFAAAVLLFLPVACDNTDYMQLKAKGGFEVNLPQK